MFPDRVVSSRTISDSTKSRDKPKVPPTQYTFNLPIVFITTENEEKPKTITKRYVVEDELEPSTFANLYIVGSPVRGPPK